MAYNTGFPIGYQPIPQYYAPNYQTQMQNIPQQQTQNNSGFVRVQNENEARMYPVAPGNSVIFIDENAPYCYAKTVDVSQLDRPKFEKYRLVKEDNAVASEQPVTSQYASKNELDEVKREIENIKAEINQRIAIHNPQKNENAP